MHPVAILALPVVVIYLAIRAKRQPHHRPQRKTQQEIHYERKLINEIHEAKLKEIKTKYPDYKP